MNTTHLHGGFPNKETILSAMGFSEVPTTVDISHALYFIICNSCWFNDIQNIYMPNLHNDLIIHLISEPDIAETDHSFFSDPFYSYDRYLRCALIEYQKLSRYISHSVAKGCELDYFDGELSIFVDEDEEPVSIHFNKQKTRCITRTRNVLLSLKNKIREQQETIQSSRQFLQDLGSESLFAFTPSDFSVREDNATFLSPKENVLLHTHIQYLEKVIHSANLRLEQCQFVQTTEENFKINLENLQKNKLMDDLNMRAVEFCYPHLSYSSSYHSTGTYGPISFSDSHFHRNIPVFFPQFVRKIGGYSHDIMSKLPTELLDIVASFVGTEVLEHVRQKCVMDRYFSRGRDDVVDLLKKWRNADLLRFSRHVYLEYDINFERCRWRRILNWRTSKKVEIIEMLVSGKFKLTFFDFLRDVFILTRILISRRVGSRSRRTALFG